MSTTRIVYTSFDRFPSPKGAANHIDAFVRALGRRYGQVDLLTVPSENADASFQFPLSRHPLPREVGDERRSSDCFVEWSADGVRHFPLSAPGVNLFERVLSFRTQFRHWWRSQFDDSGPLVPVVHFRSIFEGYPIARQKKRYCRNIIYEVNGLPSIELKYRYPRVADDAELLKKIQQQEEVCLAAADLILTVSQVNAEYLIGRGVNSDRICVIPNGVELDIFPYQSPRLDSAEEISENRPMSILYSGTMSAWQGVSVAIEALALLRRDHPAILTLVGHAVPRQTKTLLNRAWELGVYDHIRLLEPVTRSELAALHHQADVVVAPLTPNDRNLVQGCCPLKVLEAMASGTPLIASDLPVVRELTTDNVEALLVHAGSAKSIKDGMLRLLNEKSLARRLSLAARTRVERDFTWAKAQESLLKAYDGLLGTEGAGPDKRANSPTSRSASIP